MVKLRWIAFLALVPFTAAAETPSLNNLTLGDYDKVVKELSANFAYSTVTPASSLGGLWGFEFGVVGGLTKTPEIKSIVNRTDTSYKESKFPHGGLLLRVGAPLGLTGEIVAFPERKISKLEISQYSGAAMWTITDLFFTDWPVSVATKGFFSKTGLNYTQSLNNSSTGNVAVNATLDFDNTLYGGQLLVSKKLFVFEPYLGLGYIKSKGEFSVSAATAPNASIFLSGGRSAESKPNSAQLLAGLDVKVLFISLGAEYQKAFGTSTYNGRLSFRF